MLLIIVSKGWRFFELTNSIKQLYWKPDLPSSSSIQHIRTGDDIMIHLILQPQSRESGLQKELPSRINYLEMSYGYATFSCFMNPFLYQQEIWGDISNIDSAWFWGRFVQPLTFHDNVNLAFYLTSYLI